jgi:hypothetical protein
MSTIHVKNVSPARGPVALEVGVLAYGDSGHAPDTPYTTQLLELGQLLRMPDPQQPPAAADKRAKRAGAPSNTTAPAGEEE